MTDGVRFTAHALARLQERYGVTLTADERASICAAIAGDLGDITEGVGHYDVRLPVSGLKMRLIVKNRAIVTVLPRVAMRPKANARDKQEKRHKNPGRVWMDDYKQMMRRKCG